MLTFDTVTRAALKGVKTKKEWVAVLNAALGNTRRIRAFRDDVEFRNVGSTGAITVIAGSLTKLGTIKNTTISLAADIFTGAATIRVEGNGRFMQGTLGPSKKAQLANGVSAASIVEYDFVADKSFTADNGFGIMANFELGPYRMLSSGLGPLAPEITRAAPSSFEVWNWMNPNDPVLVGTFRMNRRFDNFVYEDEEMANAHGDVVVLGTTESVVYGLHEFAAITTISDKSNSEDGNTTLYGVLITSSLKDPTWPKYPLADGFDYTKHVVNPDAFKIIMRDGNGNTMHTFQMRDGMAINDLSLPSNRVGGLRFSDVNEVRPSYNVAMVLPWTNVRPRMNPLAKKIYPGMRTDYYRPTSSRVHFSVLSCEPLLTGGYSGDSKNGLGCMWAMPDWPRPKKTYFDPIPDKYLTTEFNYGYSAFSGPFWQGWRYEPGSFSGQNWYTAPGGPRMDRAVIPSVLAMYLTYPDGLRPQGAVPWKDMAWNWCLAYANHSNHWFTDPKRMYLDENEELFKRNNYAPRGQYYGDTTGINNYIQWGSDQRYGETAKHRDKQGNLLWNGWGRDPLHAYAHSAWGSLVFSSPIFALLGKSDTFTACIMDSGGTDNYMVRTSAWYMHNLVMGWKTASRHEFGVPKKLLEDRFLTLLKTYYDTIYVPVYVNNSESVFYNGIRNLGTNIIVSDKNWQTKGGGLGMYLVHVFQMMRQTGLWHALYSRGGYAKTVLDMMLQHLDHYVFGVLLDTPWTKGSYQSWPSADAYMPTSWADYATRYEVNDGQNLRLDASGNLKDRDVGNHPMMMWPFVRRDYFPENPHPRLQEACNKVEFYEQIVRDKIAAAEVANPTNWLSHMAQDLMYRYPALMPIQPPAPGDLGPT